MISYEEILHWIDEEMEFDKWYTVKSDEQIEVIKDFMRAGFFAGSVFDDGFSKFKRLKIINI